MYRSRRPISSSTRTWSCSSWAGRLDSRDRRSRKDGVTLRCGDAVPGLGRLDRYDRQIRETALYFAAGNGHGDVHVFCEVLK